MEIIEFMERTDCKSLNNCIKFGIRQKLNEYEDGLKAKQQRLRDILTFENMQFNEEILLLVNQRLEASHQQRMDWINTKRMEKEMARQELLKLKKQQRELENCEEWRHMQTKQLLVLTKEAQLYQIEEKKALRVKEKIIEENWQRAMERIRQEREFRDGYEAKLRKVIEGSNQQKNLQMEKGNKIRLEKENEGMRRDYEEDNMKAVALDEKRKTDEKLLEFRKKMQQGQWLKSQMRNNLECDLLRRQQKFQEDFMYKDREDFQIFMGIDENKRAQVRNKEWHKLYLQNCNEEKQQKQEAQHEYETMYLNTGCVLQQSEKRPYAKNCR